ncbi:MAG: hypothetical protein QNL90_17400 [Gammaproteobacteria bacterium]|nr:hypothetical protein [Gammaproteobacteria bacterium]MDX2461923.1 hypothetical protein [Gammaproteobacteria bacterium]
MTFRPALIAMFLSVLAVSPVYAGGADGGCAYGSKYQQTSVEPQEQSEAAKKLASLSMPAATQEEAGANPQADAEKATAQ